MQCQAKGTTHPEILLSIGPTIGSYTQRCSQLAIESHGSYPTDLVSQFLPLVTSGFQSTIEPLFSIHLQGKPLYFDSEWVPSTSNSLNVEQLSWTVEPILFLAIPSHPLQGDPSTSGALKLEARSPFCSVSREKSTLFLYIGECCNRAFLHNLL